MNELRYLPLRAGTNIPAVRNWPGLASADPAVLERWREEFPRCNWGVLTGHGIGVLDIDTKGDAYGFGGFDSLIRITELLSLDLSNLPLVETYSGAHLYFAYEGSLPSKVPWLPHLDVKADGGHQVAGPGTIRDGDHGERTYRLTRGSLNEIPLAPKALLTAIRGWRVPALSSGSAGGGTAVELPKVDWLREHGFRLGQRDNGFNALVWKLTRTHYPHMDLVHRISYEVWLQTDNPPGDPFPWAKVEQQIERAKNSIGPEIETQLNWAKRIGGDHE
ncbi:bifunctional DNA primase/polymerase [Salinibacterium sp. SWN139]|uniref:bifunctional DNA primase/polymerase n=1 Tax=Salinibacterium sp. SWN139 TaxID=2792055 RepID=UPI0018CFAEC7|nr:bifunctional DNA primase/polymerase [Salinibacterium sp. SWN139]MBH0053770.1 bifunctional DNA primase/polymerase [Salinibacterium sp. SWN139]